MKLTLTPEQKKRLERAMTLIELSVVILVLLSLISILFIGARAWKRGSDRAACTMQIRQVQVAVRSFSNLNNHQPGTDVSPLSLQSEIIGSGLFMEATPTCPATGIYSFGGNTIPTLGSLYMTCSLATVDKHVPETHANW